MARPKPDTKQVQQFILNKAISLIQKQGYPQLTMRRLANDCGMSVGKIYHFFPGKDALFLELEIFFFTAMIENLQQSIPTSINTGPESQFKALLMHFYHFASTHLDLYRLVTFPPKVFSDFIGDSLEQLARKELDTALAAITLLKSSMKTALTMAGITDLDDEAIQRRFLFLVNAMQGLILNSHSPIFPYIASTTQTLMENQYQHPNREKAMTFQLDAILKALFSNQFPL